MIMGMIKDEDENEDGEQSEGEVEGGWGEPEGVDGERVEEVLERMAKMDMQE